MILENQTERGLRQSIDWKLIACYLLLVLIGWFNIYASIHSSETTSILDFSTRSGKQFIWILTAFSLALLILFAVDRQTYRGVRVREAIARQDAWFQIAVIVLTVCAILVFGLWGPEFNEANFLYFQF